MKKRLSQGVLWVVAIVSILTFQLPSVLAATLLTSYNTTSTPAIASDVSMKSIKDPVTGILYTLTDNGVSLINLQGTVSLADDTVEGSYNSTFLHGTPMSAQIKSPMFLDSAQNLLYVGTDSGLAVVATQGTATIADDTLLVNYTNVDGFGGSPTADPLGLGVFARTDAQVNDIALDTANGLIYVGFYSGNTSIVVIDTHGTLSSADDTIQNYGDSPAGPGLTFGYVNKLLLHGNILYVGSIDHGSMSVVDTQGTVDISDDVELGVHNSVFFSANFSTVGTAFAVNTNHTNILYVGLNTGLGVVDTQGTDSPTDDVLLGTYTNASTPAVFILTSPPNNDFIRNIYFDSVSEFVYVTTSAGVSIIDTKGTNTLGDDTLVASYSSATTPALANNAASHSFYDRVNQLLYVATDGGLSVIDFPEGLISASTTTSISDIITVNLPINATISITSPADVTMGAITGTGQSALTTNQAEWITKTNNAAGYELSIQASNVSMQNANLDTVAGYTPATPSTPEPWSIVGTDSEWGMHYSFPQSTLGNDTIWGAGDTYSDNWVNVPTIPYVIETATAPTDNIGDSAVILFGAEVGASKIQPTGTYSVDVTMTATTL